MRSIVVGNGVNRLFSEGISWEEVLKNLSEFALGDSNIELKAVPFPIVYEQIFLKSTQIQANESLLLKELASHLKGIRKNKIHDEIIGLGAKDIITTNYDYAFFDGDNSIAKLSNYPDWDQNSFYTGKDASTSVSGVETVYRFRTFYELNNVRYWHIHGELSNTNTIVLGHDKYSKVIANMEDYLGKGLKKLNPFVFDQIKYGWMDLFFISDIDIIGLQMHYTEIDIWYLLNQRARMIKRMGLDKNVPNRIRYFDLNNGVNESVLNSIENMTEIDIDKLDIEILQSLKEKKAFKAVLESHYIEYVEIVRSSYMDAYNEYLTNEKNY